MQVTRVGVLIRGSIQVHAVYKISFVNLFGIQGYQLRWYTKVRVISLSDAVGIRVTIGPQYPLFVARGDFMGQSLG